MADLNAIIQYKIFNAGDPAIGDHIEALVQDLIDWSTQINTDNFDSSGFTGLLTWDIDTSVAAIKVVHDGSPSDGVIDITHNGQVSAGKAILSIIDNANQTLSDRGTVYIQSGVFAGRTMPLLHMFNQSAAPALKINGTGAGMLLQLQATGVDQFTVDASGNLTCNEVACDNIDGLTLFLNNTGTENLIEAQQADVKVFAVEDDGHMFGLSLQLYDTLGPLLTRTADVRLKLNDELELGDNGLLLVSGASGELIVNNEIHGTGLELGSGIGTAWLGTIDFGVLTLSQGISNALRISTGYIELQPSGPQIYKDGSQITMSTSLKLGASGTLQLTAGTVQASNGEFTSLEVGNKEVVVSSDDTTSLRIVRGEADWNGSNWSLTRGEGISGVSGTANALTINFFPSFGGTPTVTFSRAVSAPVGTSSDPYISAQSTTACTISNLNTQNPGNVTFIIVGPK